ncbi:efflux RND transporter periplasmic adaptor subunit [Methylobacterium brachythecii]|nr:HlyD family efflux transporter periplasmic adaptor subunit [Methylobacterium brachythecii]MBB3901160.1 multidrug efflux pump subunit AcrA (membrane-fusion protein) [Methylobacterium brachythecii]
MGWSRRAGGCIGPVLAAALAYSPSLAADEPSARPVEMSVSVRPVHKRCFRDRIEITGTLVAREIVDVGAEQEGTRVIQVLAQPLDEVASGQVLARVAQPGDAGNAPGLAVRAPVAGFIVRSAATVGLPVSSSLGPLFRIAAKGDIELEAGVAIDALSRLKAGQAVTVTPLGLAPITGKTRRVDESTDPATQLGKVRVGLGTGQDLRIGTFARAIVEVGESCGLSVPFSSVTYEPEGTIVHVVAEDRIEARQVAVGLADGEEAEIRSGLGETDVVLTRAGAFVREGDRVHPVVVEDKGRANGSR